MGLQFHRRVPLGSNVHANVSRSGLSFTRRAKWGSIGTAGFSLRTGIPGLTYRHRFSRKNQGAALLILLVVGLTVWLVLLAVNVIAYLAMLLVDAFRYWQYRRKM